MVALSRRLRTAGMVGEGLGGLHLWVGDHRPYQATAQAVVGKIHNVSSLSPVHQAPARISVVEQSVREFM